MFWIFLLLVGLALLLVQLGAMSVWLLVFKLLLQGVLLLAALAAIVFVARRILRR